MEKHLDAARSRLAHLAGLSVQTDATEQRILESGEHRLAMIQADIDRLRPRVNLDPAAADAYQAAILERGQLQTVTARSREHVQ